MSTGTRKTRLLWPVVVALSVFTAACTQRLIRFNPPPPENPGLKLPAKVEVTLNSRDRSSWGSQGERPESTVSGNLEAWENGILVVATDHAVEIPADRVEMMEIVDAWGEMFSLGCLSGGAAAAIILLLLTFL
jgi:hypothetical protein